LISVGALCLPCLCEGDNDSVEKPVDPVRVYSEKELTKEFEKVAGMLTAEQDWSVRMVAMQRVEGLVFGGATEYACFPLLLKQLVGPLNLQLADRRSSIVKQVTSHLYYMNCQNLAICEPACVA
jgi:CLIP-associating protein 1/2